MLIIKSMLRRIRILLLKKWIISSRLNNNLNYSFHNLMPLMNKAHKWPKISSLSSKIVVKHTIIRNHWQISTSKLKEFQPNHLLMLRNVYKNLRISRKIIKRLRQLLEFNDNVQIDHLDLYFYIFTIKLLFNFY